MIEGKQNRLTAFAAQNAKVPTQVGFRPNGHSHQFFSQLVKTDPAWRCKPAAAFGTGERSPPARNYGCEGSVFRSAILGFKSRANARVRVLWCMRFFRCRSNRERFPFFRDISIPSWVNQDSSWRCRRPRERLSRNESEITDVLQHRLCKTG